MYLTGKEKREYIKERFVNPFNVGDILHLSWGYDQTQCDFYQVTATTKAGVTLKPIAGERVEGSEGFMSQRVVPVKDKFIERFSILPKHSDKITEVKKRVSAYIKDDGTLKYFVPSPHGFCDKWDGNSKYNSWYA